MKIQELKEHLEKYKDALVLVGPDAIKNIASIPSRDDQIKFLNNKNLRRSPKEFWDFYFNQFYIEPKKASETEKVIAELYKNSLVKNVVTLYPDGLLSYFNLINPTDIIHLHGNMQTYQCQKASCKINYPIEAINKENLTCEVCGNRLRPQILLSGENYNEDKYQAMISLLNQTHTLFTIGLDYTETPIVEFIADYCDLKGASEESKVLVSVVDKDLDMDLNEQIGFHEFIVKDDCDAAMIRLLDALR